MIQSAAPFDPACMNYVHGAAASVLEAHPELAHFERDDIAQEILLYILSYREKIEASPIPWPILLSLMVKDAISHFLRAQRMDKRKTHQMADHPLEGMAVEAPDTAWLTHLKHDLHKLLGTLPTEVRAFLKPLCIWEKVEVFGTSSLELDRNCKKLARLRPYFKKLEGYAS